MAYTSWPCPDLGGVTLYSSDYISNPDWSNYYSGYMCPIERPSGYNIVDHFGSEIQNAIDTQTAWTSGIIVIGRAGDDDTGLRNVYLLIQLSADPANDTFTVVFGYGNNTSSFYSAKAYTTALSGLSTLPEYMKCVYVFRFRGRNMSYDRLPGYTGNNSYVIFFGTFTAYKGVWENPSQSYPYGRMRYTQLIDIDPATCLISTPCAENNQASRQQQSSAVMRQNVQGGGPVMEISCDYMADANGNHDGHTTEPDPNEGDPGGNSKPGGGDGDHSGNYDPIPVPPLPTIGPYSAGFIYMLNMAVGQMQQFADEIARPTMWQAFKSLFADPLDFMCGVMLVPYVPGVGSAVRPMYGENSFEHMYNTVSNQYTEVDCGSIYVNKYYGSCFDHNPYHKLLLWLPYIGYRELDPDEFSGKYIHVIYHCDCMTGDCVAFVKSESGGIGPVFGRVVAQFSGNCGVRVPYGRTSFDAAIQSSIQLLGGAVGMAAGGALGVGGLAAGNIGEGMIANSIQGATIMAVTGQKTGTERSGTAGASAGYLSIQKPYLLRTLPQQSLPENYISLEGYPSNVAGPLSKFSGYVGVESINLNNIAATKAELDEIDSLLKGGVFI